MKVILKADVSKLGKKGDLVEVSDGYGRNFVIARGLGEEATPGKMREWEGQKEVKKVKADRAEAHAREQQKHLQGRRVTLTLSAGEGGKLFGSVTAAQLAEAIEKQLEAKVDKKDIRLPDAIRQVGVYSFTIRLHTGVEATLSVNVEAARG